MKKILFFLLLTGPLNISYAAQFVSDTFTGTNGSTMATGGHVGETGATWVAHSSFTGIFKIDVNRAVTSSAVNAAVSYASGIPLSADYHVDADLYVLSVATNTAGQGVAARISASPVNTMVFFRLTNTGWQCQQVAAGVTTQIGVSSAAAIVAGQSYSVSLIVNGSDVTGTVGGITVCSGTTSVLTAGKAGIRGVSASSTTGIAIDNFSATDIVADSGGADTTGGGTASRGKVGSNIDKRYEDYDSPYWEFFE